MVSEAISETILSLDEIAAHHYIDEVYVHQIEVVSLNHEEIRFIAHGSIKVQLQWGSNSDVRRGDDTVILDFFPLICNLASQVESPEDLRVIDNSLCVDTSSWWDGYYDHQ